MWQYQSSDELYHHGILGMKWGYRKSKPHSNKKNRYESKDSKRARKIKKKKLYQMSNDELRTLNARQELESKYKKANPNIIRKGAIAVGATAAALGTLVAIQKNSQSLIKFGKDVIYKTRYKQLSLF